MPGGVQQQETVVCARFCLVMPAEVADNLVGNGFVAFPFLRSDICAELIKAGSDKGGSRCVTGHTVNCDVTLQTVYSGSFHVPVGDEVFGHVGQVEEEIGNAFTLLQIGRVFGEAVAHGETVQSPSLSAAPERIVRVTLVGTLHADFTVLRMIVYHMVGRVVRAEMIFQGGIGMVHGYIPINGVSGKLGGTEQHLQVHHVVYDDGIAPYLTVVVPGTDAFHLRAVAGHQSLGTLQHYVQVRTFTGQLVGFSEAVVHHKAEVVRAPVPLGLFNGPRPGDGSLTPVIIMRIGIHLPQ